MQYLNLRKGLISKPKLIPMNDDIYKHITDENNDWYISLYQYNDKHVDILKEKGTLAGTQDVVTDIMYFDFDDAENPNNARKDAQTLIKRLEREGIEDYSICFSGMKGFSVEVYTNDVFTPPEFKATLDNLAGDLKTFDTTVSDPQRIVRVPNTKHQKSNLYKIPLTKDELDGLSLDEIKTNAKNPRFDDYIPTYINLPSGMKVIPKKVEHTEPLSTTGFDVKNRPAAYDEARWMLSNGFFESGERNTAFLCLAAFHKSLGYPLEISYRMLKGTAELQAKRNNTDRYPDGELYNNIVMTVYGNSWKGGTFSIHDPNSWLYKYAKSHEINTNMDGVKPARFGDIDSDFLDFVKNIEENTIKTGIKELDDKMLITIGSCMGIVAAPSVGKSAIALDILNNTSKAGVTSVFASLDMYRTRIYEKLINRVTDGAISREDLYDAYKNGKSEDIKNKVEEEFKNVWFYDRSSPTVQHIRDYVLNVEKESGNKVKLIMIDYFERVSSEMSDDTAASKRVMAEIQDMMNDLNCCVIVLFQPNKHSISGGPSTPLLSYTAIKGSSFVFQSLRNIVSMWRPFLDPELMEHDKYLSMAILKNDLGELGKFDFKWFGKQGKIKSMEDHEREELKELIKWKESIKAQEKKSEWQ